jgi:hypothetical protein
VLDSPEVARLTNEVRDSFRIRPNHSPSYVDVADHLTRLRARQHQIVFGRRGSGKSCLFVHFLHDREANNGVLPIYLDSDELKRLGYPDLLIRLLLRIFESTPDAKSWWRRLFRFPNAVQRQIDELRHLLDQAEESKVVDTEGDSSEGGGSLGTSRAAVHGKKTTHRSRQTEFQNRKLDKLERALSDYKVALQQAIEESSYESAFVLVDDFYLIPRERQPDVIDYLHRLLRGTNLYLKVGTVRHRTTLLRQAGQTIGVELHQDIEELNLDRTLEDVDATSEYLSRMLEAIAYTAGLDDPKSSLFNPEVFSSLVLASGGVPRDFLNIFVEAVDSALAEGKHRWLTPTNIWKGASRISYRTKLNNLRDEAEGDVSPLEEVYRDLVRFCLKEKRKTGFLVSQEEAQEYPDIHEIIHQLMDFKLIHVVEPDTSAASGRKGRFEAYTLDFSLFMEPRMRNIEHIEFWRTDTDRRRVGLREAPDYSLERARHALREQEGGDIGSILEEANKDAQQGA